MVLNPGMKKGLLSAQALCPKMCRSIQTRTKKVEVQLLKESYGRRFKGEVFQVSEGHMRLKLHPEGIAAYVIKNQPTPIPVLSAESAQQMRREVQLQAKAAATQAEEAAKQTEGPAPGDAERQKVQSLIDALDFPSATQQKTGLESGSALDAEEVAKPDAKSESKPESTSGTGSTTKKFSWQNEFVANLTEKKK